MSQRSVLLTGGTGGIGRRIDRAFADAGDRVVCTSRTPADAAPGGLPRVGLDLADPATVRPAVDAAVEALGGLDTLVANAVRWPTQRTDRFEDLPESEWREVLRANVEGTFALVQAALPALRASRRGRIVFVSSGAAEEGQPVTPHYVAAKAALHGLARALAWDTGADGVLVNVVAAGFTRTDVNSDRFPAELFAQAGALTPRRAVSTAEDVAAVVAWLGSDANTSITGEVVREGTSNARSALVALG
jgi:NAD(P)-dependent dehydrogenase (short-subunit alcohol dehydrogenase family)